MVFTMFECTSNGQRVVINTACVTCINFKDDDLAKVFLTGGESVEIRHVDANRLKDELTEISQRLFRNLGSQST